MAEPFLSEIRIMSFVFAPKGWALCNGQLLPINQNQALFSLLGTTFGGDGRVNFGLPDLRGRTPIHVGSGHTFASVVASRRTRCRLRSYRRIHMSWRLQPPREMIRIPQTMFWRARSTSPTARRRTWSPWRPRASPMWAAVKRISTCSLF